MVEAVTPRVVLHWEWGLVKDLPNYWAKDGTKWVLQGLSRS